MHNFFVYLVVMAGVTYLVRMLPFVLVKGKIENKFLQSFLHYIPYAVLSVMTVPAVFFTTSYVVSAVFGFIVAFILAYYEKGLLLVACAGCAAVFVCETVLRAIL